MSKNQDKAATGTEGAKLARRDFLRTAGIGAAAAVVVAAPAAKVEAAENAQERKKARYRETEHVKKYYDSNRL